MIPSLSCACPHLLVCNVSSSLTHPYPHGGISRHPVNFHPPLRGGGTLSKSELLLEHHFHGCCDRESNPSFFMACLGAMCRPYYALAIITVVIISVASGQGLCLHIPPRNTPHRSAGHTQDMEVRLPRFSTHCNAHKAGTCHPHLHEETEASVSQLERAIGPGDVACNTHRFKPLIGAESPT